MLLQKLRRKEGRATAGKLQQFTGRNTGKRGAFFFPYINSVESEFGTSMNCCVKLIYLMLNILE